MVIPIAEPSWLRAWYNVPHVRGPAAEFTPPEIRGNAVWRGSTNEEAALFRRRFRLNRLIAAAFRRCRFGAGRFDTVLRPLEKNEVEERGFGADRFDTVLRPAVVRHRNGLGFGTGRDAPAPRPFQSARSPVRRCGASLAPQGLARRRSRPIADGRLPRAPFLSFPFLSPRRRSRPGPVREPLPCGAGLAPRMVQSPCTVRPTRPTEGAPAPPGIGGNRGSGMQRRRLRCHAGGAERR